MSEKFYSLIEMGFTGAIVIGFAVWQLVSINREIAKDKAGDKAGGNTGANTGAKPGEKVAKEASPERPGHPVGEHRLDDR